MMGCTMLIRIQSQSFVKFQGEGCSTSWIEPVAEEHLFWLVSLRKMAVLVSKQCRFLLADSPGTQIIVSTWEMIKFNDSLFTEDVSLF